MARKAVIHLGVEEQRRRFGTLVWFTGTLCNRESLQDDGINSTSDTDLVTCKLCRRHPGYIRAAQAQGANK